MTEKSYVNYNNHGLVKTDSKGKAKLVLNCPQIYSVDEVVYPRHIHYTLKKDKWDKKLQHIQ